MGDSFRSQREAVKRWQKRNPEKIREYRKKARAKKRSTYIRWMEEFPERCLLERAKLSSSERKLDFDLTVEDIQLPESCPLLGCLIFFDPDNPGHPNTPSLDRIDNTKGYVKGNVWVISKQANTMKNNASLDDLLTFSSNVIKIFSGEHE